jgi:hypothetical protein
MAWPWPKMFADWNLLFTRQLVSVAEVTFGRRQHTTSTPVTNAVVIPIVHQSLTIPVAETHLWRREGAASPRGMEVGRGILECRRSGRRSTEGRDVAAAASQHCFPRQCFTCRRSCAPCRPHPRRVSSTSNRITLATCENFEREPKFSQFAARARRAPPTCRPALL